MALAEGIAATVAAIRAVQPEALFIHVEDTGREWADRPELSEHAAHAQERRLLPLDLACGKVDSSHPWFGWLVDHGACEADLYHLIERLPRWDALGVNFYPWSNRRHSMRRNGRPTSTHDPAPSLLEVLRMIHRRYGLHVMITETSSPGSHADRAQWMAGTLSDVRQARGEGIPVVGYTWFPMFTMIEWKYRWSRRGLEQHLLHLGLWDVLSHNGQRDREATPLVETYRRFIANTDSTVGAFQSRHIDGPIGNSRVEMVA
jgi:hypothetical protein